MKRIPQSFKLGAHRIEVRVVSKEEMAKLFDGDMESPPWGLFVGGENRIYIQKARKGFNKQAQLHTFWHEFFHALYWNLGRTEMFADEVLVDQCGNLLLQALQSAE